LEEETMKRMLGIVLASGLFGATGCAAVAVGGFDNGLGGIYQDTVTPTEFVGRNPGVGQALGAPEVKGEACMWSVLGFVTIGDTGYEAAVKSALAAAGPGAIALYDVRADRHQMSVLGVYANSCTVVTGRVQK
jgi:hypothetical protein